MFESSKTVANIISTVNASIDNANSVGDDMYLLWVNEIEQILYSEIIKEYAVFEGNVTLPYAPTTFRFEDIQKLYLNGFELAKTTADINIDDTFYKSDSKIAVYPEYSGTAALKVIYFARPTIKTATAETIKLPIEWLKIVLSYCKSMAYKEYNNFTEANNWLAEYNAYVQDFAAWVEDKRAEFGK